MSSFRFGNKMKLIQRTELCWHCGIIVTLGRRCPACGAFNGDRAGEIPVKKCSCGKVYEAKNEMCPYCGRKS